MSSQGDIGRNKNDSTWPEDGALHLHQECRKVKALAAPKLAVVDSGEKGKRIAPEIHRHIVKVTQSGCTAYQPSNPCTTSSVISINSNCLFVWIS